jgi:hypothetical protein
LSVVGREAERSLGAQIFLRTGFPLRKDFESKLSPLCLCLTILR